MRRRQAALMGLLQAGLDALVAALAAFVAYEFRFHVYPPYIPGGEEPDPNHYLAGGPLLVLGMVAVFFLPEIPLSMRSASVTARPLRPARPVRPIRCT